MNVWRNSNSRLNYLKQRFILQMIILILALPLNTINCFPINNGFTLKFTPMSVRDEVKVAAATHGSKFTKIPQKDDHDSKSWDKVLAEPDIFADMLRTGNTNQIAKLLIPNKRRKSGITDDLEFQSQNHYISRDELQPDNSFMVTNEPEHTTNLVLHSDQLLNNMNSNRLSNANFNLPLLSQPHNSYKMFIATSPPHFKLGDSDQPVLIYVVFPEDEAGAAGQAPIIPTVYFVKQTKPKGKHEELLDPIFIVDHNRTVTGIKSREVPKYITFRSKYLSRKEIESSIMDH